MRTADRKPPALIPELKVTDFQASLRFYTGPGGFDVAYDRPEEDFAMLSLGGAWLMIEGLTGRSRTMRVGALEYPLGRGLNLQIEVPDVAARHAAVLAAGHPVFSDMEEKWYRAGAVELGNRQFWVQDPDGYLLRFFEDLGSRSASGT